MNIKIIGVGKLKEKYFKAGIAEYAKRLGRYCQAEMDEVMAKEGERILSKIKDREYVFALAINGKERSSEEFAQTLNQLATYGHSDITFVIGGSLGLSPAVLKRANEQISFGRFTLPHQLMRLVLTEQIYRAFTIINGLPYHK